MRRLTGLLILSALLAVPARAALYMKSHVYGSGPEERPAETVDMSFEGWFAADRAVINVLESNNAMFREGKIYVEGTTMTLYDPAENTCAPWDVQAMMRFAGAVMESMGGVMQLEFDEPEIEVLDRASGRSLLGRRVDYLKYRSNWSMSLKVPLMKKRTFDNSTVQEVWFDPSLADELPAFGVFMDADSFTTGYEEMDEAIQAGIPPVDGPVLKSIAIAQTTNQKGKVETTTTTSEVTELELSAADPAGGYSPPADCQVVSTFPGAPPAEGGGGDEEAAAADGDEKPWSKIKVKNPFGKKKKDDG